MASIAIIISTAAMAFTAVMHSWIGERRIVMPILAFDQPIVQRPLFRWIVRYAWHLLSFFMLADAVLVWNASDAATSLSRLVLTVSGVLWLLAGITTFVGSRAKHIGWPPITIAGVCALLPLT